MSWGTATVIVDAAIEGSLRATATAWQIASGNEGARFPAYVEAANERPELRGMLDDVIRPFVAKICEILREQDWDGFHGSKYYGRFGQEMHGFTDQEWAEYQKEQGK